MLREPVNAWTHFLAFWAAMGGLAVLVVLSRHDLAKVVTMTVYGVSLVLLFGASTLYHGLRTTPRGQLVLRRIDHVAIYFLIAGSYTPVFYYGLPDPWRWPMLGSVWGLAVLGMLLKIWLIGAPRYLSAAFYLALGWIALVPSGQLFRFLPSGALVLALIGGAAYTLGAVIYATRGFGLGGRTEGFHEVFHLLVIVGSAVHFAMMIAYIVPL